MPNDTVDFSKTPDWGERVRYDWPKIAEKLRRTPNKWGLIFEGDRQSLVVALRSGSITHMKKEGGFHFRTTNNRQADRTCDLWAMYVPEDDTTKENI